MTAPLLSVAICTFERARMLDDALRSFAEIRRPPGVAFEVLVVDNNSADATRAVADAWSARAAYPLRYVFEGRQGLSAARNRAVAESAGDWIWFVDDDVYFDAGWLEGARDGIAAFPEASMLAGRVVPTFEPRQPAWLPPTLLPFYGMTAFGDAARWLTATELPVGANAAFRRSSLTDVAPFRTDLGRIGHRLLSHEESDLVMRLRQRGHRAAYAPRAAVLHRVPESRATMGWLRKRAYWGGISYVLADVARDGASRRRLLRKACRRLHCVLRAVLRTGLGRQTQIECAWDLGRARQYLAEAARRPRHGVLRSVPETP